MTKASDMSYTIPDEKVTAKIVDLLTFQDVKPFLEHLNNVIFSSFQVVITYVAYLCTRLLDLREETKAARCIQMAWRRHRLKRQLERNKV